MKKQQIFVCADATEGMTVFRLWAHPASWKSWWSWRSRFPWWPLSDNKTQKAHKSKAHIQPIEICGTADSLHDLNQKRFTQNWFTINSAGFLTVFASKNIRISQILCLADLFLKVDDDTPQNDNKNIPQNLAGHLVLCLQQFLENPGEVAQVKENKNSINIMTGVDQKAKTEKVLSLVFYFKQIRINRFMVWRIYWWLRPFSKGYICRC